MNGANFFTWIRDGVRQSVLLGVSDAVEQLGTPVPAEDLHPSVAGFLQVERNGADTPKVASRSATVGRGGKMRLGKSLKEMGNGENA